MADLPSSPSIVVRPLALNQSLSFFWGPPQTSASTVTSYVLECSSIPFTETYSTTQTSATVNGLTNRTPYTFTLAASNDIGLGPNAVFRTVQPGNKPQTSPSGVSTLTLTSSNAVVQWDPPLTDGGADIQWYTVLAKPTNTAYPVIKKGAPGRDRQRWISGLNPSASYTFEVYGVNDPGYSPVGVSTIIAPVQNGLIAYFDARSYSGSGDWADSGPFHYDASTINGTPSINSNNTAVILDGSTAFRFANPGFLSTFTVSVWFKDTGTSNEYTSIVTESYTGGNINLALITNSPVLSVPQSNFAGSFFNGAWNLASNCDFSDGLWHNQVVTFDGTDFITYFDSSNVGTTTPGSAPGTANNPYFIGKAWDGENYVKGELGQLLIYNKSLLSNDVLINYQRAVSTFV